MLHRELLFPINLREGLGSLSWSKEEFDLGNELELESFYKKS